MRDLMTKQKSSDPSNSEAVFVRMIHVRDACHVCTFYPHLGSHVGLQWGFSEDPAEAVSPHMRDREDGMTHPGAAASLISTSPPLADGFMRLPGERERLSPFPGSKNVSRKMRCVTLRICQTAAYVNVDAEMILHWLATVLRLVLTNGIVYYQQICNSK